MKFCECLNQYLEKLPCSARQLSEASGLSAATLSRYRSGERLPDRDSESLEKICAAIETLSTQLDPESPISCATVREAFLACTDISTVNRELLRKNFNALLSVLSVNITALGQYASYDTSTIFRFRNGTRQLSDPVGFASAVAEFIAREKDTSSDLAILSDLLGVGEKDIEKESDRQEHLRTWLLESQTEQSGQADSVSGFLSKLDEFDLNAYIKAIHFDQMKLPPTIPFQLPTSRHYYGLREMMESELDFLKATVLSKATGPVIMYSDMPMGEMAKDPDFPKKWMFGMAMMLKKGLHLHQIHNLDRSFEDMMLGLESWIPMYMTGQISPYYLKNIQNNVFLHLLKVSETAALSGEAMSGHQKEGRYYLTRSGKEVSYYKKRAEELLELAHPLMNIYTKEQENVFKAFLTASSLDSGSRRSISCAPPIYTMEEQYLEKFLVSRTSLTEDKRKEILQYAKDLRAEVETMLEKNQVSLEIPSLTREEFDQYPVSLPLSDLFYESDLPYTWEEYCTHLEQTRTFSRAHPNYLLTLADFQPFRNLQIRILQGKWAMVSKNKTPAIHFVIQHPKLRAAIENMIVPVRE